MAKNKGLGRDFYSLIDDNMPEPKSDPITLKLTDDDKYQAAKTAVALDKLVEKYSVVSWMAVAENPANAIQLLERSSIPFCKSIKRLFAKRSGLFFYLKECEFLYGLFNDVNLFCTYMNEKYISLPANSKYIAIFILPTTMYI